MEVSPTEAALCRTPWIVMVCADGDDAVVAVIAVSDGKSSSSGLERDM